MKGSYDSFNGAGSSAIKQVDEINKTTDSKVSMTGKPNSVTQKVKDGKVVSERYYDEDGNAYQNAPYCATSASYSNERWETIQRKR